VQRKIDFSVSPPKVAANAPNGYTQGRRNINFTFPVTLDNGETTIETVRITFANDIETDSTRMDAIRSTVVQVLNSSALDEFFNSLSVS
jgi:hypothetical protein